MAQTPAANGDLLRDCRMNPQGFTLQMIRWEDTMTKNLMKALLGATILGFGTLAASVASADCDWKPKRAVTYIVPWGAGGGTDANARMLSSLLSEEMGQPFNVVNRTAAMA